MEKIKNLVNPGSKKDDEIMYGSGRSDDPVHSGNTNTTSGQGSHFGSSRTAGPDPLSTSTNPTGTSQYIADSSSIPSHGLNEPYASRMPGGFDDDDAATTASVSSGVPGYSQSGSTMTGGTTGTNNPSLTNKPLPREPASAGTGRAGLMGTSGNKTATGYSSGTTGSSSGSTSNDTSSGYGSGNNAYGQNSTSSSLPDRSVGSSGYGNQSTGQSHLGRDALGAGVGAGAHHHHGDRERDNYAPETGRSFPLGGSSNTTSSTGNTSGRTGTHPAGGVVGSATHGPHASNLINKADPRVDNDLDGSRTTGNVGHDSATGGYGSGTGPNPNSANQGTLGRETALGAGATGASATPRGAGYGPESWEHDHSRHGHAYEGDPCGPGETIGGPHFVSGPHVTDIANRLDPHVGSGSGATGTSTGSSTGLGLGSSSTGHHHGQGPHRGEEAVLAGGAGAGGSGAYESRPDGGMTRSGHGSSSIGHHGRDTSLARGGAGSTNDGSYDTEYPGSSSSGPAPNTAGPHKSDLMNKIDPRIDSDLSKQQGITGTAEAGRGTSTTGASDPFSSSQTTGRDHHYGRDGSMVGAGTATGAGVYEAERHRRNQATGTTSGVGPSNPYGSSDVDPRVDSSRSGTIGTGMDTTGMGRDRHHGRDAGLGAGAGTLAYEAERHHGQPTQSSTLPSTTGGSAYDNMRGSTAPENRTTGNDHHYGRDAGLVGAGGVGAYEVDKRLGSHDRSGIASTPQDQLAGSGHQPVSSVFSEKHQPQPGHHHHGGIIGGGGTADEQKIRDRGDQRIGGEHRTGRDAAMIGGGTAAAGDAAYEADKPGHHGRSGPGTASNASYSSSGYGNERAEDPGRDHHQWYANEFLEGGTTEPLFIGHSDEWYKKNEAKFAQKQHAKEEKALEKEHSRELKHHEKALAKEEKSHEKAIEKSEKSHDKQGEKKHGGLLGFLHRDKSDKTSKEEDTHHQQYPPGTLAEKRPGDEEMSAGQGAGTISYGPGSGLEHDRGSQPGVHDTPIGSGITTHDAYEIQEGHNKLHKDPPSSVLESRRQDQR